MKPAFEKGYLLENYQDNYPLLSSLDPVTITRSVLIELRRTLSVVVAHETSPTMVSFGKEVAGVIATEFAKIDPDYVMTPKDGRMAIDEAKSMALALLDIVRTVPDWVFMDITLLTAQYMPQSPSDVGIVLRFSDCKVDVSLYGELMPIEVSDFVVSSVRTIVGR